MSDPLLLLSFYLLTPWVLLYLLRFVNPFPTLPCPIKVNIGLGYLSFHTHRFNRTSQNLLEAIGASPTQDPKTFDNQPCHPRSRRAHAILLAFYDIGTIIVLILQIISLITLAWLFFQLLDRVFFTRHYPVTLPERLEGLVRRAVLIAPHLSSLAFVSERQDPPSQYALKPLIPGLTLPLGQLPTYLLSLTISQTFHEFGHAFSAALNNVPVLDTGLVLAFPVIPIFYVSVFPLLPGASDHPHCMLLSILNLRIATAGLWHNLVLAASGWIFWNQGGNLGGKILKLSGLWKDVGQVGVGVVSVSKNSPISSVLFPDEIITHLNHLSLSHTKNTEFGSPISKWENFLLSKPGVPPVERESGWCVNQDAFSAIGSECCGADKEQESQLVCFTATSRRSSGCLDRPTSTRVIEGSGGQCATENECGLGQVCARPSQGSKLVWFNVTSSSNTRTVFFQGSRHEILADVRVSRLLRTSNWIPIFLEPELQNFYSYLISLSIGTGFLNLLPIRNLDGTAIAKSLNHIFEASTSTPNPTMMISDEAEEFFLGHVRPSRFEDLIRSRESLESSWLCIFVDRWWSKLVKGRLLLVEKTVLVIFAIVGISSMIEVIW